MLVFNFIFQMKKIVLFISCAALFLTSCQKEVSQVNPSQDSQKATVSLSLAGNLTKATVADTEDEAKVSDIQIFVFNGDAVDGYKKATSSEVAALKVDCQATTGKRDIYAVVNAPDLASYTTKTSLLDAVSLLSDNASDKFVMCGKLVDQSVTTTYSGTVQVDRYAARVRISKITRKFSNSAYQTVQFKITKLYLTSAVSNERYSYGVPDSYSWLNASFGSNRSLATGNSFVYDKLATPATVAQNESYTTEHSFYAYANIHDEDDTANPKSFKCTRLVIETQIDANADGVLGADEYFTYPIRLGAVGSNKSYEIKELVITMLGNHSNGDDNADDGEDDDIEKGTITVTIDVNDWTEVLLGTGGTVTL